MKKVKVMLMAIAVVAVTGGLVAAKVNKTTTFCTTNAPTSTTCPTGTITGTQVTGAISGTINKVCTAALVLGSCPTSASSYATAFTTTD